MPGRPSISLLILALFGTALIVIGVAGELYVDIQAGKVETQIRGANDKLLGLIIQEAGDAKTSAEGAAEGARRAEASAGQAQEKAAAVGKRANNLTTKLSKAEGRIDQAKTRAEQLSKDILDVEAELSDRIFDDQGGAGGRLSVFAPVSAVIEYLPTGKCEDCEDTAGQISLVLHDFAKWSILPARPNPDLRRIFVDGVIVQLDAAGVVSDDTKRAEAAAEALVVELNKTHIKAIRHAADPNFSQGVIVIRVGRKPNPVMERLSREWKKMIDEQMRRVNGPPAKP